MTIFLICKNCNWEIIPMLLGAWLLGLLFWIVFFKKNHQTSLERLTKELEQTKNKLDKSKRDLVAAQYKNQKITSELTDYTKRIKSLEVKIQQLEKGK